MTYPDYDSVGQGHKHVKILLSDYDNFLIKFPYFRPLNSKYSLWIGYKRT